MKNSKVGVFQYNFGMLHHFRFKKVVLRVGEIVLAERLESGLAKYVAKGTESDGKDSRKLIERIANCNELNRGPQIINYNI